MICSTKNPLTLAAARSLADEDGTFLIQTKILLRDVSNDDEFAEALMEEVVDGSFLSHGELLRVLSCTGEREAITLMLEFECELAEEYRLQEDAEEA
jgi:hypothetical protein